MTNEWNVTLTEVSTDQEIFVAKTLSNILGLNLKEARSLLEHTSTPPQLIIFLNKMQKDFSKS